MDIKITIKASNILKSASVYAKEVLNKKDKLNQMPLGYSTKHSYIFHENIRITKEEYNSFLVEPDDNEYEGIPLTIEYSLPEYSAIPTLKSIERASILKSIEMISILNNLKDGEGVQIEIVPELYKIRKIAFNHFNITPNTQT